MSDIISQVWPDWHVKEMLGQGSYGKVYRAVRSGHGHTSYAAIKVMEIPQDPAEARDLSSSGMDDLSVRGYFEQRARSVLGEVALMEELKGAPNVVSVEDYQLIPHENTVGWTVLVRMPLLESAKEHFARVGQPDDCEVARLGADVCRALTACHAKGVIHRDVKPENVFWGEYGYQLGDFGIARRLGPDAGSAHTRAGAYPYMAPEVFAGSSYGTDVDTYSLGLVMYRYLNNGRAPFLPTEGAFSPADSERAVALRLAGRALPAPKNADENLAAIVLRAADPDPDKRFNSAAEMRIALEMWLREKTESPAPKKPTTNFAKDATVVLDQQHDKGDGQKAANDTNQRASRAAASVSSAAQKPLGANGTVQAGTPTSSARANAGQPYNQATGMHTPWTSQNFGNQQHYANAFSPTQAPISTPAQGAPTSPKVAQSTSNNNLASKLRDWPAWVIVTCIVAVIVVAVLFLGPLFRSLFGSLPGPGGSSSSTQEDNPTSQEAEPTKSNGAEGTAIEPGGYLIDDDICTIQIKNVYIDSGDDLRFDFTVTNHTDRELSIDSVYQDDGTDGWTVNGSSVDCGFVTDVGPEETKDDFFWIYGNTLPVENPDEIYSVAGPLSVSFVSTSNYDVSIPDSSDHSKDGFAGSRLIDDDICTVEVTGTYFDSSGNLRVNIAIENHTDEELYLHDDGLWAVNGVYAETVFSSNAEPGETKDDYFFIEPDTLPTSNADEIESIAGPLVLDTKEPHYYDVSL